MKKVKIKHNNEVVKPKLGNILCIILKEGKGAKFRWLHDNDERFSVDGNTYFLVDDGTHIRGRLRIVVYLEGISLPIHHGYIKKESVKRSYTDRDTGKEKSVTISKIKGLNFDSNVIDMLLNRNLADEFTKNHVDLPNLIIILLLIIGLIVGVINIGMWFL